MDKMLEWFRAYNSEITWFIIGWLSFACIDAMVKEQWGQALLDAFLVYLNYRLWKARSE